MRPRLPFLAKSALVASTLAAAFALGGCGTSDEQNPISPQQMNDMRAKENAARQNHAAPSAPSPGNGATSP